MDLEAAYVLHRRAYRNTSAILDVFTPNYGRVALVARGVLSATSRKRAMIQPFTPVVLAWKGAGDLASLTTLEPQAGAHFLKGTTLYSALYLNELLIRVLPRFDPLPEIYEHYHCVLAQLATQCPVEIILRQFELHLLAALGFGVEFRVSGQLEVPFVPESYYRFSADEGFSLAVPKGQGQLFSGKTLIHLSEGEWSGEGVLHDAKRLCRLAMRPLLGNRPLLSGQLFKQVI